jgi:hypothetical protein
MMYFPSGVKLFLLGSGIKNPEIWRCIASATRCPLPLWTRAQNRAVFRQSKLRPNASRWAGGCFKSWPLSSVPGCA